MQVLAGFGEGSVWSAGWVSFDILTRKSASHVPSKAYLFVDDIDLVKVFHAFEEDLDLHNMFPIRSCSIARAGL